MAEVAVSDTVEISGRKPLSADELASKFGAGKPSQITQYLNIMIYGNPGAGKTHLCGTAEDHPMTKPILLFDVEGGTTTLRKRDDISVVRVKNYAELWNPLAELSQMNEIPFRTVIVDSVTELQKMDIGNLMKIAAAENGNLDADVPDMKRWGKSGNRIRAVVRRLRDMNCNTVFTALAQTKRDTDGTVSSMPDLPGKLAADIPGFIDVVGYLYVDTNDANEIERRLLTQPTSRYMAKDRTDTLGQVTINPTFPMLWDKITAGSPKSKTSTK